MKPRAHSEIIKQWAEGYPIQYRKDAGMMWTDCEDPAFVADYEYRVKPTRQYVETSMTDDEIKAVWSDIRDDPLLDYEEERRELINTALRHAIDQGQVVTREEFDKVSAELKEANKKLDVRFVEQFRPGKIIRVKA